MAEDVLNEIDSKVKNNKVMLFMKGTPDFPQCGFSAHTVEILKSYGVPFATADVLADAAVRDGIKRYLSEAAISCTNCMSGASWSRCLSRH
jgi:monothiol glutaredoxin